MSGKLNKYYFLVFAVAFFAVAAVFENGLLKKHPEIDLIEDFQKELLKNERMLNRLMVQIDSLTVGDSFEGNFFKDLYPSADQLLEKDGLGILVYKNGRLQYWSDRIFAFYDNSAALPAEEGLLAFPNGYYLSKKITSGDYEIFGLHLVKYNFRYENKYLKNSFFYKYKLPEDFGITEEESRDCFSVYNLAGEYLFSIKPLGSYLCTTKQLYKPGTLYLFGLLFLLIYFRREFVESKALFLIRIFAFAVGLFLVYWLHLIFQIPKVFFLLRFFSPSVFALNNWLPSLGDYLLLSFFFLFWLYNFGNSLDINQMKESSGLPCKVVGIFLLLFSGSTYLLIHSYARKLILNSTISFSLYRITEISVESILAISSVGLLLLAVFYFTIKIIDQSRDHFSLMQLTTAAVLTALFLAAIQLISVKHISVEALALFVATTILASLFSKKYLQNFTLSYLVIFVSLASAYSLLVFYSTTIEKQRNEQRLMAVTLVAERDPAAEVFLGEIQEKIGKDPEIPRLLIEEEGLINYIDETYFGEGYFNKYNVRYFVCTGTDSLLIEMDKRMESCMDFFEEMFQTQGVKIQGTNFYFMDNMNGRISYSGWIHYPLSSESRGVSIFIELNSELLFEGIGFPELLIDKSMSKPDNYKKYSYAKYYAGELTDKHGDYNYNFYVHTYLTTGREFEFNSWDGMEHLIYHTREDNYVIVSRELITFVDYLISFPYLFVFYFLSVLIILTAGSSSIRRRPVRFDLKLKIQLAIVSIVFVSLLLVAAVTIWYNVKEYKEKHRNDLSEKMISIAAEIDAHIEDDNTLSDNQIDWLNRELSRLSNTFQTDINIYGTNGAIIATSRPEIYYRGLISDRMNSKAYNEIFTHFQISYFQPESIGLMSYLSAYRPIINNAGDYLGVINLPYFIKQDRYSQELSTIIVAFINLYVLLLLASIIVALFIANQITRPLVLLQENFKKIELGKRNEPIFYARNDEIGSLIKEYNRKVDELAVSAELLARSERESAWREMARQIAHEIKNPLTPMKLNVQHLQRTKGDGEDYEKLIQRITDTLIEQIDNLSNIATEFSSFAQIPTALPQIFKLSEQIEKVIDLYEPVDRVHVEFHANGLEYIDVKVDRDQFSRAIINLVKNAIQSIPDDRKGRVDIHLSRHEHVAVVSITDNGEGISEELSEKLFTPSFTTKTSGMGLGLAIVKNIVDNFSGRVWFKTKEGKGTTFYMEIPIWEDTKSLSGS